METSTEFNGSPKIKKKQNGALHRKQEMTAWFMSAPALIVLLLFLIAPFFLAFYYSFTNQLLLEPPKHHDHFVGLQNYHFLLSNNDFIGALLNNVKFTVVVVPVQTILALLLALLINNQLKFINFFRMIYFSPVVISMVVVSIVWSLLFTPGKAGFINSMLSYLTMGTFAPKAWLHDPHTALIAIMILSIWQGVGFQMVIFLAGLQFIPGELYEAANIDGANKLQQFFYVTLPQLKNTTVFVMISTTIFSFKLFDQVMVLTDGGPQNSTNTLVYLMYSAGFTQYQVGYASAIAVIFFIIVLVISILQMKVTNSQEG